MAIRTVLTPHLPMTAPVQQVASGTKKSVSSTGSEKKKANVVKKETKQVVKNSVQSDLLKEMQKNLQEIESSSKAVSLPKKAFVIPEKLSMPSSLQEETFVFSYEEELASYLQNTLELPEYGDVKVRLEIDASGKLISLEILEMKSRKNGEFLKKRLSEIEFPPFSQGSRNEVVQITIVFKNLS